MKFFLKTLRWLLIIVLLLILAARLSGNQFLLKGIWAVYLHGHKTASIDDARFFDTRNIETAQALPWQTAANYNQFELSPRLDESLTSTESVAFLIARNGKIEYEQYWDGYTDSSRSNSFSMAKSITTMLVQCAIQDGAIKSWDQKVTDFFPEIKGEFASEVTLRNLSTMTAGLDYNEHYTNPFDITAKNYYGPDAWNLMIEKVPASKKPGSYEYQSGATQWLGMVVIKATGKHLADYAAEKLWQPLGAEHAATWHLDNFMGTELAFCCFNSNARDFARFGQLLLQNGSYNGVQILDSAFLAMASQPFAVPHYGHSFWILDDYGTHVYAMRGLLGQYVIVIPEYDAVIVRLGHHHGKHEGPHTVDFKTIIEECLAHFSKE